MRSPQKGVYRNEGCMKEREKFGSRLGFILVSAGCAIGLGNVWKFPYICGEYGGAAFIIIYLIFLLFLGLPILVCEFSVGRASRKGIGKAYDVLEPKGAKWHSLKWFDIVGNYLLMMFYTMVGGWMLNYAIKMGSGQLAGKDSHQIVSVYQQMLKNPVELGVWALIAIVVSFGICAIGLQNGVEKITKVMMLCLIGLMCILAIHSFVLPNAMEGIRFYVVPNFDNIRKAGIGNTVFAAMSQAFFTLSVGMGSMEIFGSYIDKKRSLTGESMQVIFLDTFVALMAGFIILPACFSFGVAPDSGPSLLFITLPGLFGNMSGGRIWGTLFFVFMSFAALSTIIAVFENIIAFFMDMNGWSRKKAVAVSMGSIIVLSVPAVLGYNLWSAVQLLGQGSTIMDLEDFLVSCNVLPLGSMIFVLFCVKKNGWGFANFIQEANTGEGRKFPAWLQKYMTYVLPLVIVFIYLKGYYDKFKDQGTGMLIGWMCFAVLLLAFIFRIVFYRKREQ